MVDRLVPFDRHTLYSVLKASVLGVLRHPRGRGSLRSHVFRWAYSSVGLEHTPDKREVGSSNLPRPTNDGWAQEAGPHGAVAQLGERRLCKP